MDDPDHDLRRSLAAGDRTALAALYDRHGPLCYRAALVVSGSPTLAEDAVQEVFMRIARDPARPAAAAHLAAYLLRMARNAAIDLMRSRRSHADLTGQEPAATDLDPTGDERAQQVLAAVASLPPEQREVVHLRIWEGRRLEDIAVLLGLSPNTVSSRWRYAVEKLNRLLATQASP